MAAMPAHAHALAGFPLRHARAQGIDDADDFMAGHAGILQAWPLAFFHDRIAVADAAGLHFDPHPAGARLGNVTFNEFKSSARAGNLGNTHFSHKVKLVNFRGGQPSTELTNDNSRFAFTERACCLVSGLNIQILKQFKRLSSRKKRKLSWHVLCEPCLVGSRRQKNYFRESSLKYEKEFATVEDRVVSKPRLSGHHPALFSG
jgi:hypothetical protein